MNNTSIFNFSGRIESSKPVMSPFVQGTLLEFKGDDEVSPALYASLSFAISLEALLNQTEDGAEELFPDESEMCAVIQSDHLDWSAVPHMLGLDSDEIEEWVGITSTWVIPLVAACRVKGTIFSRSHVATFLQSVDGPRGAAAKIFSILYPMRANLPDVTHAALASNPDSQWVKYRVTASSTPSLFQRAEGSVPLTYNALIPNEVKDTIYEALIDPASLAKSRLIPEVFVGYLAAMLDGADMKPDAWFAGERAANIISGRKYRLIKECAKKETSLATDLVSGATTLDEFKAALSAVTPIVAGGEEKKNADGTVSSPSLSLRAQPHLHSDPPPRTKKNLKKKVKKGGKKRHQDESKEEVDNEEEDDEDR